MTKGWDFAPNGGGTSDGFNNGALDNFAGRRLSGMVREIIQNSLDAVSSDAEGPVTVSFSLYSIPKAQLSGLNELNSHIVACEQTARNQEIDHVADHYKRAQKTLSEPGDVATLVVSDYNTAGLTGPLDEHRGPWFALTKGTGLTQKQNASALGSFGHGSKAPFLMAELRTLFYLSKIKGDGEAHQLRFQGKTLLQSHVHPERNETTQGTGFYGVKKNLAPLIDEQVPEWALKLREQDSQGTGTSIIIPFTSFGADLFPETKITVVANFYYAILTGKLAVVVDGERIDSDTVEAHFHWCVENLPHEQDEIDVEHVEGCFKSIRTLVSPTYQSSQEITNFGRIDWFLRISDDVDQKAVAISRESGMLITRKPEDLKKFPGLKQFDMFVFVNPGVGSASLKRLENPEHDNFEKDRVRGAVDEREVKASYKRLITKIRETLKKYASSDTEDEEIVSDLAKYLFQATAEGTDDANNGEVERGVVLTVRKGTVKSRTVSKARGKGGLTTTGGFGGDTGSGARNGNPGKGGGPRKGGAAGSGAAGNTGLSESAKQLENLRVIPIGRRNESRTMKLKFHIYEPGKYRISVCRRSETGDREPLLMMLDGKERSFFETAFDSPGRHDRTVELCDARSVNFALEAWADEV